MDRFNTMPFSQDELSDFWQKLVKNEGLIHRIVRNDDTTQKMEILQQQVASYGDDERKLSPTVTYSRIRRLKEEEWGLWERC